MRIGFIGAGLIATYHSKSLKASGAAVVRAGVFDPDRSRAEEFASRSGHTVCDTEAEVFDGCDAVYVCTWTSEHPRLVAEAARRGLHVFCEKPLATDLRGAEAMLDDVTAAGVTNQVGLVLRRSPAYVWAHHLVTDPAAGRVMAVVFRDDQFIPIQGHYGSTWRQHRHLAGAGTLLEHSIHDIDMLRYLVGDITSVSARQSNLHGHDGIEDVVAASMSFAGGAIGTLVSVWHDNLSRPSLRRVEIFCERRTIVIEEDDWFGPVSWSDADGASGSMTGDEIVAATEAMIEGPSNPDGAFVRAASTAPRPGRIWPPPSRHTGWSTRCTAAPRPTGPPSSSRSSPRSGPTRSARVSTEVWAAHTVAACPTPSSPRSLACGCGPTSWPTWRGASSGAISRQQLCVRVTTPGSGRPQRPSGNSSGPRAPTGTLQHTKRARSRARLRGEAERMKEVLVRAGVRS